MDFFQGYSESKVKPYLKMAVQRINLIISKKTASVKAQKREVAQILAEGKVEKAKIKVETIIQEDNLIEGHEVLSLLCELLHERIRQITANKECPTELRQAVSSVIWAASNVTVAEMKDLKKQFSKKYGSEFAEAAEANEDNLVNPRLFKTLTYVPPTKKVTLGYLTEIAKAYQVQWEPSAKDKQEAELSSSPFVPDGSSVPPAPGSEFNNLFEQSDSEAKSPTTAGISVMESYGEPEYYPCHHHHNPEIAAYPAEATPMVAYAESVEASPPPLPSFPPPTADAPQPDERNKLVSGTGQTKPPEDSFMSMQARLDALNKS